MKNMAQVSVFEDTKKRILSSLTNFKFIEKTSLYGILIFLLVFMISNFSIYIFQNQKYAIFTQVVSILGFHNYTPFAYIFNIGCFVAGILILPFFSHIFDKMNKFHEWSNRDIKSYKLFKTLGYGATLSGLMGNIGFIGVGIFSMSFNPFFMHEVFATLLLLGFMFLSFFMSCLIIVYDLEIPVNVGIYGICSCLFIFVSTFILIFVPSVRFEHLEWIWLFIIISWLTLFIRTMAKTTDNFFKKSFLKYKKNLIKNRIKFKPFQ